MFGVKPPAKYSFQSILKQQSELQPKGKRPYGVKHQVQAKIYLGKVSNSNGYKDGLNKAPN
jgi:hypothetical protein